MIKKITRSVTWYKVLRVFGVAILALGVVGSVGMLATFSPFSEFEPAAVIVVIGALLLLISWVIYSRCSAFIDHTLSLPNGDEEKTNRFQFSIREWQELWEDIDKVRGYAPKLFYRKFIGPLEILKIQIHRDDPDFSPYVNYFWETGWHMPRCIHESLQEFLDGKLSEQLFEDRINMIIDLTFESSTFKST